VTALPYDDDSFDGVWCASVSQYLTDAELGRMVDEFVRVVRPGGLVAIKDADPTCWDFYPPGPRLMWHLLEAICDGDNRWFQQTMRCYGLPASLQRAGLDSRRVKTTLIERIQPLQAADRAFLGGVVAFLLEHARQIDLPEGDLARWTRLGDPDSPHYLLNDPEFYYREARILAVGSVPQK
jgi:SAM-dependent methyltransferase